MAKDMLELQAGAFLGIANQDMERIRGDRFWNHPIVCTDCVIGSGAYQPKMAFRPKEMSISVDVDVDVLPLRDSFPTLFVGEPRFDVVVKDDSGRELHLPNARIVERLHTLGRIPRKLKKALKKKHGVYWKQHHPNVERFYSISNKD